MGSNTPSAIVRAAAGPGKTRTYFERAASAAKKAGMFLSRAAKSAHRRILGSNQSTSYKLSNGYSTNGKNTSRKFLGRAKNAVGRFFGGRTRFYNKTRSWGNFTKQIFSRKLEAPKEL